MEGVNFQEALNIVRACRDWRMQLNYRPSEVCPR